MQVHAHTKRHSTSTCIYYNVRDAILMLLANKQTNKRVRLVMRKIHILFNKVFLNVFHEVVF